MRRGKSHERPAAEKFLSQCEAAHGMAGADIATSVHAHQYLGDP